MLNLFGVPLILQVLVVVSPDWNVTEGTLYRYQRSLPALQWEIYGHPVAVTLGKNGMAWGIGLHDLSDKGVGKKEGDGRSPAGLFSLGPVFGDETHQVYAKDMPFLLVTDDLECVDDPQSVFYNQFIKSSSVEKRDWKSSEHMKKMGPLYALGLVVQHNLNPTKAGMGSAIFMHVWECAGRGTSGCTAMEEANLIETIAWLDSEKNPCLVQLPLEEYVSKKALWGLPELSAEP